MEIAKPRRTRRTHSVAFKQALVTACEEPGASVAGVALANGVNANQVRRWMRERGVEPPPRSSLAVQADTAPVSGFVPVQVSSTPVPVIRLELRKGAAVVKLEWPQESAAACGAWLREWLG
ncbi:MAG: transposase [Betaproteobacteria bacterium]|nr:MAG: transposase [Betaproteobacteria bacterium]